MRCSKAQNISQTSPLAAQKERRKKKGFSYLRLYYFFATLLFLALALFYIDYLWIFLKVFPSFENLASNKLELMFYIFIYSILGGTVLPLPVEAPLVLYTQIPLLYILFPTAIGRGFGAYLISQGWTLIDKLFPAHISQRLFRPRDRISYSIGTKGFVAYLFMQSIPFMPLRSSIYAYSYICKNSLKVVLGAAIGAILRNLLMLLLVFLGYISIKAFF